MTIEKIKILGGRFGATSETAVRANQAHLAFTSKWAKWTELAVLFSW